MVSRHPATQLRILAHQDPHPGILWTRQVSRIQLAIRGTAGASQILLERILLERGLALSGRAQTYMSEAGTYNNPIIRGFHPDPSICRVGPDYYLVTSTFEYFPGVALFHSKDLVHFEHIGHVLTRKSQLDLGKTRSSHGIFAPTLRYHDGTFYMITTHVGGAGNFYVTATEPRGPWSEPVWLADPEGVDPSLFFDEDGTVYYVRQGGAEVGGAYLAVLDVERGRLLEAPKLVWSGSGGTWPEGPHLYKRGAFYYLILSEGGTGYEHMLTVARAKHPFGPYEPYAKNPILTHRHLPDHAIQATGHGDWVTTPEGKGFIVFLGIRPCKGRHHHLGRETFLAPFDWSEEGWPVVGNAGTVELEMTAEGLPTSAPQKPASSREDFDAAELGPLWSFTRTPSTEAYSLTEKPSVLRLYAQSPNLDEIRPHSFVGRRQQHLDCTVRAHLEFLASAPGSEAGLCLRANDDNHYDLVILGTGAERTARLRKRLQGKTTEGAPVRLPPGPLELEIRATAEQYEFSVRGATALEPAFASQVVGTADTRPLSSESAGTFTGVLVGMFTCAKVPGASTFADFDWFDYCEAR